MTTTDHGVNKKSFNLSNVLGVNSLQRGARVALMAATCITTGCASTNVDDQTVNEVPDTNHQSSYQVDVEVHSHARINPVAAMLDAIRAAPDTIEGYHPLHAVETFPGTNSRGLSHAFYNYGEYARESLTNAINSGRTLGYIDWRNNSIEDNFVYNRMPLDQKLQVKDYINTMMACRAGNFSVAIETYQGGIRVDGNNQNHCDNIRAPLMKIHGQGFRLDGGGETQEEKTGNIAIFVRDAFIKPTKRILPEVTGGAVKTGDMGRILGANERCAEAGKLLDMDYDAKNDSLSLSCKVEYAGASSLTSSSAITTTTSIDGHTQHIESLSKKYNLKVEDVQAMDKTCHDTYGEGAEVAATSTGIKARLYCKF